LREDRKKQTYISESLSSLKHITGRKVEGTVEVTGRRGRRRKQLLDEFKKRKDTGN